MLLLESIKMIALKSPEDILANGVQYPASGSFINVGDFGRFGFLIHCGALANQQTFQVRQATAVNGTLKDVEGAVKIVATGGADKWYLIEVDVDHLDTDGGYVFVTLQNAGGSTGDYADLFFLGTVPGIAPVTQGSDFGAAVRVIG